MSPAKGAGWDGFAALRRPIFWAFMPPLRGAMNELRMHPLAMPRSVA